jgi:hypothetical protein
VRGMKKVIFLMQVGFLFCSLNLQGDFLFRKVRGIEEIPYGNFAVKGTIRVPNAVISAVDVTPEQNIVALIIKDAEGGGIKHLVRIYDKAGNVLKEFQEIGTAYQMDGEVRISNFGLLKVTPEGNIIVCGNKKVALYNSKGEILDEFTIPEPSFSSPTAGIIGMDIKETLHIEQAPKRSWKGIEEVAVGIRDPSNFPLIQFARPIGFTGPQFKGFGSFISLEGRDPEEEIIFFKGIGYMPDGKIVALVSTKGGRNPGWKFRFFDRSYPDFPEVRDVFLHTDDPYIDIQSIINIPMTLKVTSQGKLVVLSLNGKMSIFDKEGRYLRSRSLLKEGENFMGRGFVVSDDKIIVPGVDGDGSTIYIFGPQ